MCPNQLHEEKNGKSKTQINETNMLTNNYSVENIYLMTEWENKIKE